MGLESPKVAAVIVAYNRAKLLQECLDGISAQTYPVSEVIVVDNCSSDDSAQIAQKHPAVTKVVCLSQNTGGAGGFTAGIAHALGRRKLGLHDFLWIMDDDTIPSANALEELVKAIKEYPGTPALAASQALWTNGKTHPMNAHRRRPFLNRQSVHNAQQVQARPVRAASFVSILIEVGQVLKTGLPVADYFIWNDDLEYTARLLKNRVGLYVPSSVVWHKTKALASATDDPGDRFYYESRNKMWFLLRSSGLRINDRLLYGGSTAVRWAKLFWRSQDRRRLAQMLLKGLPEGVLGRPRKNPEVFKNDPETQELVAACERVNQVVRSKKIN